MATAAAPTFASLEERLRNPQWERAENVHGAIEEKALPEKDRAAWQFAICFRLVKRAERWTLRVRSKYRTKAADTRYRNLHSRGFFGMPETLVRFPDGNEFRSLLRDS